MLGNLLKNNINSSPATSIHTVDGTGITTTTNSANVSRQSSLKYTNNDSDKNNQPIETKNIVENDNKDIDSDINTISIDISPSVSTISLNNFGKNNNRTLADNNVSNKANNTDDNGGSSQSASVFLRSLLRDSDSSKMRRNVAPLNTTDSILRRDSTRSNSNNSNRTNSNRNEENNTPTIYEAKINNVNHYPKLLNQIADDSKLELFGCKMMPISKNIENEPFDLNGNDENSSYPFRILIAEENEQLACRNNFKIFLDHSHPQHSNIAKIRPNELRQYMFCSLFRAMNSKKHEKNEKFRTIPNSEYMILTRIFYLNSPYDRIAITLCLPNFLIPIITEVWSYSQNWMDESQRILSRIILEYKRIPNGFKAKKQPVTDITESSAGIHNKHVQSNLANLQNMFVKTYSVELERIISILENYLIPCFKSTFEIPRLFLFPPDDIRFVETWFRGCFKWIELKDGPKLNLLQTSLATILINYKRTMFLTDNSNSKENTRIIVLSGNVTVANKLIFLICGLLNKKIRRNLELISHPTNNQTILQTPERKTENIKMQSKPLSYNKNSVDSSPSSVSSFNSSSSSFSNSSRYNYTRNGWEIPQRVSSSSASIAMSPADSNHGVVIQPSSCKSGNNSIRYLSSSLSSQQNSYGSWFTSRPSITRMLSKSPSITGPESTLFRSNQKGSKLTPNFHKTSSSTSLHQMGVIRNNPIPFHASQESMSLLDYEESPWIGTPESMSSIDLYHAPTNRTLTPNINPEPEINPNINSTVSQLKNVNVQRDCQRIDESKMLDSAFDAICTPELDEILIDKHPANYKIHSANTLNNKAPVIDIDIYLGKDVEDKFRFNELLPRFTAYLPNLNRFYQIQANSCNKETNNHILNTMRKDLHLNPMISTVKTLVISLQAREVYEMMVKQHNIDDKGSQRMRKIFKNGTFMLRHSSSSKDVINCISFLNESFDRVRMIYQDIDSYPLEDQEEQRHRYTGEILQIFHSIISCGSDA
ncbi:Lst4p [Maudiozyma exigua]|uniref:Protein LST4 n=1 Tax=Maudiozyma exigua TaxID=34358 RepID=A0A9P6W3H3_MAUEX|nr:Lst4p [Kazachstania exigua]